MPKELPKAYDPKTVEKPTYERWERSGYFTPEKLPNARRRKPFVVSMPPPNVTGDLHLGHATALTLEDIMVRYKRMAGFRSLWIPGTDHAGIATQVMVERLLASGGVDRQEIGREVFLKHVWQWKKKYGDRITKQIRSLGSSCDWSREHFTMDPKLTVAVQTAFIQLYDNGLIYRGERIISWCPRDRTALSDLEVRHVEQKAKFYVIRYPLMGSTKFLTVATTRPETMLGDAAVAVHPKDERYRRFVGQTVILPIVEREIPIIADSRVDPDFGTGAVKITPGHDKLDHEIGKRHQLPTYTVIDEHGKMTKETGEFAGMSTQAAREAILKQLEEAGQVERVEDYVHSVAVCDRCGHAIEPRVSLQWFLSTKPLALPAIEAVRKGWIRIVPERFAKVYFHWLENIEDWCISRQLWWGHRIPIFYCLEQRRPEKPCPPIAAITPPKRCPHCRGRTLQAEQDTLDTWFSSGLWTFSTLGWPKKTKDLTTYHPTDVMETGWDILFFWVARMVMMSLYFLKEIPFRTVYLHGLVLDKEGKKMSKSKGTGIDPIPMTEKYGTDAIRLSLVIGPTAGQDTKLWEEKIAFQRNFVNKLWNVGRFVLSQPSAVSRQPSAKTLADRWILSRLTAVIRQTTGDLDAFRFSEAGQRLTDFLWHELADWYVEAVKVQPNPAVLHFVFGTLLKLLHPFTPYVSEVLWRELRRSERKQNLLIIQDWPNVERRFVDASAEREFDLLREVVTAIRNLRASQKIAPKILTPAAFSGSKVKLIRENDALLRALGRLDRVTVEEKIVQPDGAVTGLDFRLELPKTGQGARPKSTENLKGYINKLEVKLSNPNFRARAPKSVVEQEDRKLTEAKERLAQLRRGE